MATAGSTRKRKEAEPFDPDGLSVQTGIGSAATPRQDCNSNRLLAGYMAHEFLMRGTLLGEIFDPAKAEALPLDSGTLKRQKKIGETVRRSEAQQCYADVTGILMSNGTQVPGVVNPTQLARWIFM